ncbi:MAG: hypothetical protein ACLRMJ_03075 [Alistipes finegoldii]
MRQRHAGQRRETAAAGEFIDVVLEGGCTQLWIDVKTLGDEAGGNAEASRTGIAAAQSSTRREPRISWDSSSAVLPYATR